MSNVSFSSLLSKLPAGWAWQSLGDVLKVRNGFAFKSSDYQESGVLLIRQSNLGGNRVSLDKAEYLPEQFLKDHKDFRIRKGDVLIGMSGSIGKLCVYDRDEPALQNQRTGLLQFKDDSLKSWIWHYLPLIENKLHEGGKGIGVQNISASQIEVLPIPIAPKEHRTYIVEEIEKQFSRLDEAIANLKRVKANLKRYKAAVLKAAVEGELTAEWRKQHPNVEPASKLLKRILAERRAKWNGRGKYKEPAAPGTSDLPDLPNRWCWATMPQLGELNRGKSKHRPRNDSKLFGGPYPFIQTGDVKHSGGFVRSHSQTYNESGLAQSRLWPAGTLCITIAANIAETGILTYPACFPDSVVGFVFDGSPATVRYIDLFFRTEREEIARFAPATAQKNINLEILSEVAVPFPPLEELNEIVAEVERRLSVIEELETAVEANLTRTDRLRQSVLKSAFSGKLSLTNSLGSWR